MYIDFQALKSRVAVEVVAAMLELPIVFDPSAKQWRGPCPHCKEGGDRALVVTPGKGFYCFAKKTGGDCIALAAHIRDLSMRDAAAYIIDNIDDVDAHVHAHDDVDDGGHTHVHPGADADGGDARLSTAESRNPHRAEGVEPLQPLSYLLFEHAAVQGLGLNVDIAKALGIGYAKKGIMRGRVAIPLRTEDGTLLGYCGYAPDSDPPLKLPKNFAGS